jgi:hypothetical protein
VFLLLFIHFFLGQLPWIRISRIDRITLFVKAETLDLGWTLLPQQPSVIVIVAQKVDGQSVRVLEPFPELFDVTELNKDLTGNLTVSHLAGPGELGAVHREQLVDKLAVVQFELLSNALSPVFGVNQRRGFLNLETVDG